MASDDSSGARPAGPILIRIKLRYDDVEVMVQRFATNVGKSGLFLPTKSLQPIGAEIKFELRLSDDTPALVGLGRVKVATPPDPDNPRATFGMTIELSRVTPQSRALILRMLERRRALGLPEVGLPMTADIDAARRAELATGPVPVVASVASSSAPVPVVTTPLPAVPAEAPAGEPLSSLLTAPRRTTGPMVAAKTLAVTALAPEPPRRKRLAVSEVMESASGPIASVTVAVPGLDDDVDVSAAIVRARALAGGGLDTELEALREVAAAPVEISIEAASSELARQLGGSVVRRDRSARWAPPPAMAPPPSAGDRSGTEAATVPQGADDAPAAPLARIAERTADPVADPIAPVVDVAIEAVAAVPADDAAIEAAAAVPADDAAIEAAAAVPADDAAVEAAAAVPAVDAAVEAAVGAPLEHLDPGDLEGDGDGGARESSPSLLDPGFAEPRDSGSHEVQPDQIADEIHRLSELDLEDVEHTEMGEIPIAPVAQAAEVGYLAEPSAAEQALLAARLEAQLAEAEAEADDDLGLASALGISVEGASAIRYAAPPGDGDGDGDGELHDDEGGDPPHDLSLDEFDDFEILAEADAGDEDLLAAHGEQEASSSRGLRRAPSAGARPPSELDFAARLDLGEDSAGHDPGHDLDHDLYFATPAHRRAPHDVFDGSHADALLDSAGQALAAFDTSDEPLGDLDEPSAPAPRRHIQPIFEHEPSSSFTIAGIPSDSVELDFGTEFPREPAAPRPTRLPPVHREPTRAQPVHREPAVLRGAPQLPSLYGTPVDDDELEHALEALDVDLDDLSIPHEEIPTRRAVPTPARAVRHTEAVRGTAAPRGPSEDSLEIDFDDD